MKMDQWGQIKPIALKAIDLSGKERDEFILDACQGDFEVFNQVKSLLETHTEKSTLLNFNKLREAVMEPDISFTGTRVGPYRLDKELGRGGMGAVYLGIRDDGELDMRVAVKIMCQKLGSQQIVKRFRKERQFLADLKHPYIAMLFDAGTTDEGLPYFIMEWVDGHNFEQWCAKSERSIPESLQLFRKVIDAVAYAHRGGVIHRDIKPGNIMVNLEGDPKLLDFGIAGLIDPGNRTVLTQQGQVPMTPEYAAPEQIAGKPVTPAVDIYSLGLMLFQMMTGMRPRKNGLDPHKAVENLRKDTTLPGVPEAVLDILERALEPDPSRRYESCEQMATDVDAYAAGLSPTSNLFTLDESSISQVVTRAPQTLAVFGSANRSEAVQLPAPLNNETRIILDFRAQKNIFSGSIYRGDLNLDKAWWEFDLDPKATIFRGRRRTTLKRLTEAMTAFDHEWLKHHFDERGQYEVGLFLFRMVFGEKPLRLRHSEEGVTLFIRGKNPFIAALPWQLLAHQGVFLINAGWSVLFENGALNSPIELPPSPHILVIAPRVEGLPNNDVARHLESLEELLSSVDRHHTMGQHLRVVHEWPDLGKELTEFQPHIIYYFGHARQKEDQTILLFADRSGKSIERTTSQLAAVMRETHPQPPLLGYFNLIGESNQPWHLPRQLGRFIPAVTISRPGITAGLARRQALAFWSEVLLHGTSPHRASSACRVRSDTREPNQDNRWIAPPVYAAYSSWSFQPPSAPGRMERDPYWYVKLDRVNQFSQVFLQTYEMFQERKPKSLAYLWYGREQQGLDLFHQRLRVDLQEKLREVIIYEVQPEWPSDLEQPHRSFADMLSQAFQVEAMAQIPARIRTFSAQAAGRLLLVYVRHLPVRNSQTFHPSYLRTYLEWWNHQFLPHLPPRAHGVLGISYEIKNPVKFRDLLAVKEGLTEMELSDTVFQLLDELERIVKQDLLRFLQTHNIQMPEDRKHRVLDEIIEKTGGVYERVLEELKELEARAWRLDEIGETSNTGVPLDDAYEDVF